MSILPLKIGRYDIIRKIGGGGMGIVYQARDPRLERDVAIKVIKPGYKNLSDFQQRFEREAKALAQLDHPNILRIYDYGEENSGEDHYVYLVTNYLSGGSLEEKLQAHVSFSTQEALQFAIQLVGGLRYAHDKGFIHRDIKPLNILFEQDGTPVLADFGIVKILTKDLDLKNDLTLPGHMLGTYNYMAPELLLPNVAPATQQSDLYSIGVILYQILTGNHPFLEIRRGLLSSHIVSREVPRPIREINPKIPLSFEYIALKALEKDPQHRYQSASELLYALKSVDAELSGEPTIPSVPPPVPPVPPIPSVSLPPRRNSHQLRWLVLTVLLILVTVFAGVEVYAQARSGGAPALSPTPTLVLPSKTIEIASQFPTSGLETTTGLPLQRGVQMAIDDANNNHLLPADYRLELTTYNDVGKGDRSDPTIGVERLHQAIADNLVAGIIGPYYSRVAQQELSIANKEPIALISPSTIYACLTKAVSIDPNCQGSDDIEADMRPTSQLTYFRLATTDDREGPAVADYFFNVRHYKKVVLIQDDNDPYIAMLANTFKQEWQATLHGQIIPLAIPENGSNVQTYQQALQSVIAEKPDLVYFIGSSASGIDALQALASIPQFKNVAFAGDGNIENTDFLLRAGNFQLSALVYATVPIQDPAHSGLADGTSFENRYASYGYNDYRAHAASAYAATMMLIQAIKTALLTKGVSTPHGAQDQAGARKFRQAVLGVLDDPKFTYTGITGKQSFDANGDTTNHTISFYKLDPSTSPAKWIWIQQANA